MLPVTIFEPSICDCLVNHFIGKMTFLEQTIHSTYNNAQYMDGRKEMMQWYADELEGSLGNVVSVNFK